MVNNGGLCGKWATLLLTRLGLAVSLSSRLLALPEVHEQETSNNGEPVKVVRQDGTVGCRVGPPEKSVEDAPTATTVELR